MHTKLHLPLEVLGFQHISLLHTFFEYSISDSFLKMRPASRIRNKACIPSVHSSAIDRVACPPENPTIQQLKCDMYSVWGFQRPPPDSGKEMFQQVLNMWCIIPENKQLTPHPTLQFPLPSATKVLN